MDDRDVSIREAIEGVVERPYIIAFNIGFDDFPVHENPFDIQTHQSAFNGYESGFETARAQATGEYWEDYP